MGYSCVARSSAYCTEFGNACTPQKGVGFALSVACLLPRREPTLHSMVAGVPIGRPPPRPTENRSPPTARDATNACETTRKFDASMQASKRFFDDEASSPDARHTAGRAHRLRVATDGIFEEQAIRPIVATGGRSLNTLDLASRWRCCGHLPITDDGAHWTRVAINTCLLPAPGRRSRRTIRAGPRKLPPRTTRRWHCACTATSPR